MSLEQKIMAELKTAMLAKDEKTIRSLRAVKAAIILAKTAEGAGGEIKEDDETKLLQKLVKQRKDSLEIFQQQNRTDLAQKEQEEIQVIEKFLPQQLSLEELKKELANHVRKEIGAIAVPDKIQFAPGLPKTRSGKIMRRILRKIAENQTDQIGDTSTLADPAVVEALVKGKQ